MAEYAVSKSLKYVHCSSNRIQIMNTKKKSGEVGWGPLVTPTGR